MTDKGIEDIFLYHGSLDELNSRDPAKQYKFAEELEFFSLHSITGNIRMVDVKVGNWYNQKIKEELRRRGYDGLVNKNLLVISSDGANYSIITAEGTPIVRV